MTEEPSEPDPARRAPSRAGVVPCPVCGFDAPGDICPHCGGAPLEPSLRRPLRGPWSGLLAAAWALPRGVGWVLATPGVARWLAAPFVLTLALLVAAWSWVYGWLRDALAAELSGGVRLERLRRAADELPGWLAAAVRASAAAAEWLAGAALALFEWAPLQWLGWFLVGSLVLWFLFSLVYELLAGPFLDEIHARLEARWFGADPRRRRAPPDGPAWLAWSVEQARALGASAHAALLSGALIVLALPLYFVPLWGYPAFAAVCGFATAVGLLDIPFERRGWTRRQRWRFLRRNLPALAVFGTVAGFLLAIPIVGPLLLVPSASLGGLWLLCRLDKGALRADALTRAREPRG